MVLMQSLGYSKSNLPNPRAGGSELGRERGSESTPRASHLRIVAEWDVADTSQLLNSYPSLENVVLRVLRTRGLVPFAHHFHFGEDGIEGVVCVPDAELTLRASSGRSRMSVCWTLTSEHRDLRNRVLQVCEGIRAACLRAMSVSRDSLQA